MKKTISLILVLAVLFSFSAAAFADGNETDAAEETASVMPVAPEMPVEPTAPEAPELPELEGLSDEEANALIEEYNQAVDAYNEAADRYNEELADYAAEIEAYNEAVEIYNAAAEEYNAEVDRHNSAEDALQAESDARMETYARKLEVYNKNVDTIARLELAHGEKIQPQMDQLGSIGRVDSESIYELGTVLTEDYYTTYGRRSVQLGKAGDLVIYWDDLDDTADHTSIIVEQSADGSGVEQRVINMHIYQNFGSFMELANYNAENGYSTLDIKLDDVNGCIIIPAELIEHTAVIEFEVVTTDASDTVTVLGHNSIFNDTPAFTIPRFFEGYTAGNCWYNSGSVFYTNAAEHSTDDWTATTHKFSFADGSVDGTAPKPTLNINNYVFNSYSNPEPVKPVEYSANRIDRAPILSAVGAAAAAGSIERMSLREIPEPVAEELPAEPEVAETETEVTETEPEVVETEPEVIEAEPEVIETEPEVVEAETEAAEAETEAAETETEAAETEAAETEVVETAQGAAQTAVIPSVTEISAPAEDEIVPEPVPMAAAETAAEVNAEIITENTAPLAAFNAEEAESSAAWSLLNLVACILTVILAVMTLAGADDSRRFIAPIAAAASVVIFILTSDLSARMVIVNSLTPVMLAILAMDAVLFVSTLREKKNAR